MRSVINYNHGNGGMMKQVHKQDRNKKICEDCYNKLDNKEDYIHISQLKKGLF